MVRLTACPVQVLLQELSLPKLSKQPLQEGGTNTVLIVLKCLHGLIFKNSLEYGPEYEHFITQPKPTTCTQWKKSIFCSFAFVLRLWL